MPIYGLNWPMDEAAILHELGKRIRTQRKSIGITQEELALLADMDRSYFGGVERGERNITFITLYRLCLALQCDITTLTIGTPPSKAG